jgi:hypothetical protein
MSFGSRTIDPGPSPSIPVAVKVKGGVEFQGTIPIVGDLATDEYDSGLIALPTSDTQVVASRIYMANLFLHNTTDQTRRVTIQNAAQTIKLLDQYALPARGILNLPRTGAELVGLRWFADAAGVNGQVKGYQ